MKILVTGPNLQTSNGGQVTHLNNMKNCFEGDASIALNIFPSSDGLYDSEGKFKKVLRSICTLFKFILLVRYYDLIHINTTLDNRSSFRDLVYSTVAYLFRKSYVIQIHGGTVDRVGFFRIKLFAFLYKFILKKSKKVLVLTNVQLLEIKSFFSVEVIIVRNFIPPPLCEPVVKRKTNQLKILFLSRIEAGKGIFELIEACSKLYEKGIGFELHVAGDGPCLNNCINLANNINCGDNIHFYGYADEKLKLDLFNMANVFVLPSYSEGLPYSVLEAMSQGLPIVVTPVGAIPEILIDGDEAIFVEPKNSDSLVNALECFIKNNDLFKELSTVSLIKSKDFTLKKMREVFCSAWN